MVKKPPLDFLTLIQIFIYIWPMEDKQEYYLVYW